MSARVEYVVALFLIISYRSASVSFLLRPLRDAVIARLSVERWPPWSECGAAKQLVSMERYS